MSDLEKTDPNKTGNVENASNSSQEVDHLVDPDAGLSDEERKKNVRLPCVLASLAVAYSFVAFCFVACARDLIGLAAEFCCCRSANCFGSSISH